MDNLIDTWQQGRFIDQSQYRRWSDEDKLRAVGKERLLVRPSPLGNAICQCTTPDEAEWVARRLNLASELWQLVEEFTRTGNGDKIKDYFLYKRG